MSWSDGKSFELFLGMAVSISLRQRGARGDMRVGQWSRMRRTSVAPSTRARSRSPLAPFMSPEAPRGLLGIGERRFFSAEYCSN